MGGLLWLQIKPHLIASESLCSMHQPVRQRVALTHTHTHVQIPDMRLSLQSQTQMCCMFAVDLFSFQSVCVGVLYYCVSVCEDICSRNFIYGWNLHCCECVFFLGGGHRENVTLRNLFGSPVLGFQTEKIGGERWFSTLRALVYVHSSSSPARRLRTPSPSLHTHVFGLSLVSVTLFLPLCTPPSSWHPGDSASCL